MTLTLTEDADAYELGSQAASTAAVLDDDDSPATGTVAIAGAAREGETLTADISGVEDADGLDNAAWTWQWVRTPPGGSGADISGRDRRDLCAGVCGCGRGVQGAGDGHRR